jgi:serine-type D-Ala-D-Ala carboxypeptidase/endopeptidase
MPGLNSPHRPKAQPMAELPGLVLALVLLQLPGVVRAQPLTLDSDPADLVRAALGNQPGTAVAAVWRRGQVRQAGLRDGQPLAAELLNGPKAPLFEIGSITKVFTGVLLAQAVERGKVKLDDTLGRLLQGRVAFASPHTASITLQQLVTHTACLPRLPPGFEASGPRDDPYRNLDRPQLWASLAKLTVSQSPPCAAVYSNLGFAVLGEVLSERLDRPWADLVEQRISAPLGLRDTRTVADDHPARLAQGHIGSRPTPPWTWQAFAGAGALRASAADLLLFGQALIQGRKGPLGLAAEGVVTPLARYEGEIGHALWIRGPAEHRTWLHGGTTGGHRALLMVAPDREQVLVLLASNVRSGVAGIERQLLISRYPVEPGAATLDARERDALPGLAGVFPLGPGQAWTFVAQDGQLWGHVTGQRFTALLPAGPDAFTLADRVRFDFTREGGQAQRVRVTGSGVQHDAPRSTVKPPAVARLPQDALQALVGRYEAPQMVFVVQAEDGQLLVRLNDQPRFVVYPVPGRTDRFAYDVVRAELQFERYGNGSVSRLVLHQNGQVPAEKVE